MRWAYSQVRRIDDNNFVRDNFEVFNGYWIADSHSLDGRLSLNIQGTVHNAVDGDGIGSVEEVFTFTNTYSEAFTLHMYNYVDWDVDGAGGDYAQLTSSGFLQYEDLVAGPVYFVEGDDVSHREVQEYNSTRMYLTNMSTVANLRDIPGGEIGPMDLAGAIQFGGLELGVGDSVSWTVYKGTVPEPASLSLLAFGGLLLLRRMR